MSKLDSLKISECPYAFASFAAKHNALVDMLAGMVGENGISVVMAEKNAIIRANIAGGGTPGNANVTFSNVAVVTSDGRLQNVLSNVGISNNYPTQLRVANGSVTMFQNGAGFRFQDGTGYHVTLNSSGIEVLDPTGGYSRFQKNAMSYSNPDGAGFSVVKNEGLYVYSAAGKICNIGFSAISQDMAVREIDICDGGAAKKMIVLGSAPY